MARMKGLEEENRRLKKMYVEERLKAEIVADAPPPSKLAPMPRSRAIAALLASGWPTSLTASRLNSSETTVFHVPCNTSDRDIIPIESVRRGGGRPGPREAVEALFDLRSVLAHGP